MRDNFSNKRYFELLDKYFRAANYISAAQLYLLDNPLLKRKLKRSDVKTKIVGHWGTVPGQNFVYAHCDRVINKYNLDMILISGPGHGGNFFVANSYLEGTYSEFYPEITLNKEGMTRLFKRFSFPGGISSHVAPEVPGSIHEGGELGYSLAHAYGAAFDNPNLIVTTIVGDGEAETGPLATSWHSNKFINPQRDGAVLPILHLNGYKISNPTVLSRISKEELTKLLEGYGYEPHFVEGDDPKKMHILMAKTMDSCIEKIKKIWKLAREKGVTERPKWPMIVLRTPKGWGCPKVVDGMQIEGTFRAHQVPVNMSKPEHVEILENWLKSYKPEELFENYKLKKEIAEILPKGDHRISANPHTNGGLLLQELKCPDFTKYAVQFKKHGEVKTQDMLELSGYLRDVYALNKNNFRVFSPDEAMSNRLYRMFEKENRDFNGKIIPNDEKLAIDGRIMDSYLSEHMCEGWLEGYLLTGRHGLFHSYEAFIRTVDSMIGQHAKWLKICNQIDWRAPISSLNIILTSNVWQQDHNGYTHQDTGFLDHLNNKKPDIVRIYLPPDANCLLSCVDHCLKTKNYINTIVASKHPSYQWLPMNEAVEHCKKGVSVWDWACLGDRNNPDIVIACSGDTPTLEALACVKILKKYLPKLNVRFINVVDLMKLQPHSEHPHGLSDVEYDSLFTKDTPVIFAFHGYRTLIHELNRQKNTTVILTTHDMGDVDALCRRIVIIDKGKMLYDNDIEHLKGFFGSYRTLKIRVNGELKEQSEKIAKIVPQFSVSADEEWISVLVDEEKSKVMEVLQLLQQSEEITDMQLEEISTEEVIKKIYEEGVG